VREIPPEEIKSETLKEFMPKPFGNDTVAQFNPLYHVHVKD
jgi:hypothetical protein